jgi:hypothetical protein
MGLDFGINYTEDGTFFRHTDERFCVLDRETGVWHTFDAPLNCERPHPLTSRRS